MGYGLLYLGSASYHVLDKVSVTRGVDYGEIVLGGFKSHQRNVDSDSTFTFRLELVHNKGKLEGNFSESFGFGFELLKGTLVNATHLSRLKNGRVTLLTLVNEVACGCGLAGINMPDYNE
jgi:hypothetical protein